VNKINLLDDKRSAGGDDPAHPIFWNASNSNPKNGNNEKDEKKLEFEIFEKEYFTLISKIKINSKDIGIRARVTKIDQIREYNTRPGTGTVTSITVMDSSERPNNQIRLTMFGDRIERFYGLLE
jgi:hypothetical protein